MSTPAGFIWNVSPKLKRSTSHPEYATSTHYFARVEKRANGAECWRLYPVTHAFATSSRVADRSKPETFDTWAALSDFVSHLEATASATESAAIADAQKAGFKAATERTLPEPPTQAVGDVSALKLARCYFDGYAAAHVRAIPDTADVCGSVTYGESWPFDATICKQDAGHKGDHDTAEAKPAKTKTK